MHAKYSTFTMMNDPKYVVIFNNAIKYQCIRRCDLAKNKGKGAGLFIV